MVEHTRSLDFKIAFAIGLGTMIAAGIFSLSGVAVAEVGSSAVISFVIAAVVAGLTAASYSEFASIYSENGGGYLFSSRTFGTDGRKDALVYFIGVSLFLGYTGTTAFYLATMDEWFFRFIIPEFLPLPHGSVAVLTAVLLGALNANGTEESGLFQLVVTSAKVAVLLVFIGGVVASVGPGTAAGQFTGGFEVEPVNILTIAALAFITFFGFSAIAASAGEIINPRETVPKAIAASIITVTILYTLVIVAMVNSPVPAEVVAQEGETAMGKVASAALGPFGFWLIVAGAVFSMVSASNASVLAATGIGSLMGRQGHAPRRLSRIHREYGTPFWSVWTATATIVVFIVVFIALFPAEGGALFGVELGLTALTGFATLNLLVPLSLVNGALVYSRRRFPDLDRPFRVPLVPALPAIGIVANLALITNLPPRGVAVGAVVIVALLVAYLAWGGAPETEALFERVVSPYTPAEAGSRAPVGVAEAEAETEAAEVAMPAESAEEPAVDEERFRVLVPVGRPERAPVHVRLAATLAGAYADDPVLQVVNVTHVPDQTPSEMVVDTAEERADRIAAALAGLDLDVEYTVEGHVSRDVAFDIIQTAREDEADRIVMGYPTEHPYIAEQVEYDAPCDVLYANGFTDATASDIPTVTVGAGGGPHHEALLSLVGALAERGATVNVVDVQPTGEDGTREDPQDTIDALPADAGVELHEVTADSVAEGLVDAAIDHGGVLLVGASRTRRLKRWVFGGTPDRVVALAEDADVPVVVYATSVTVGGYVEDLLFPLYRVYVRWRAQEEYR
jgi:amino acid transporter/nucleotide-binding universal stress UspA family protein